MEQIPHIIHQIWSGIDGPLPERFQILGETWKRDYPAWDYEFWDNTRMDLFVKNNYPQYMEMYNEFPYNIQRWDAIRYLILEKIGGMYVDFDYESIRPIDVIIKDKTCCFASEPKEHLSIFNKNMYINNALMGAVPDHPFIHEIIQKIFDAEWRKRPFVSKMEEVLNTTGPLFITDLLEKTNYRNEVCILPASYVSPFSKMDVQKLLSNRYDKTFEDYLELKLDEAYAVHYFIGTWM
ncbi:glycosyltransferase family 32 protein [Parabacteroides sp. Marseille-P3160]|uniref:glycosyltransferase family 32 protein n=1 Tax=Parabacteroides sp. Marseille-P3160 TaxID=1917887 RepID=UPI0009BC2F35|nr:glycosyltransferase [Parabacteroides sp. Marseille-P3160]